MLAQPSYAPWRRPWAILPSSALPPYDEPKCRIVRSSADGDEVALVALGALAEVLQVAGDVDGAHEVVRVVELVEEVRRHA